LAESRVGRLDQAARAAWLYYIGGHTQDEIAAQLNISRQAAQRLVALAVSEKLIRFQMDHPVAACMALGGRLAERFTLRFVEVVPRDGADPAALSGIAVAGSRLLARWFAQKAPVVIGLSTGATLRAIAAELPAIDAPQHKVFSLCGATDAEGRASSSEPVLRIGERTGAQCYPMPAPVVAASVAEREFLQSQWSLQTLSRLMQQARYVLVGVGHIGWQAPMHEAGFLTDTELTELMEAGAVGEIAGRSYDAQGRTIPNAVNARVSALELTPSPTRLTVGAGAGPRKVPAIRAALEGRLLTGLLTDETTAAALLEN
jgi:DNA-binding transcriptional regulator LsrR (DeoR family)